MENANVLEMDQNRPDDEDDADAGCWMLMLDADAGC
jgi:hypothetical protein